MFIYRQFGAISSIEFSCNVFKKNKKYINIYLETELEVLSRLRYKKAGSSLKRVQWET